MDSSAYALERKWQGTFDLDVQVARTAATLVHLGRNLDVGNVFLGGFLGTGGELE